jgi:alpha-tubulin suppressor-like RCC1 family protein
MKYPTILGAAALLFAAGCGVVDIRVEYGSAPETASAAPQTVVPETAARTASPSASATSFAGHTDIPPTPSVPGAVAVDAGYSHTCALMDNGTVKCWGSNDHGQLGNGSRINSSIPVDVAGMTDAIAVVAGWKHTCALTAGGAVKCWGYNLNGELGNGATADSVTPVGVYGLASGVTMIDAGDDHTCAVMVQGGVRCWGYNASGQLGDSTSVSRSVPVGVKGLSGEVMAVATGWGHTCALLIDGSPLCWGSNIYGQLGSGVSAEIRFSPADVAGLARSAETVRAGGGQSCALTIYGDARCWGNNKYGQLGDGSAELRRTPVAAAGLAPDPRDIAVGWNHSCVVDSGGGLICWGWNYYGQLGDGTKASRPTPAGVYGLSAGVWSVGLGWAHSCAVTDDGSVKCWGLNDSGQLGDGSDIDSQTPIPTAGLGGVLPPLSNVPTHTATFAAPTATKTAAGILVPTVTRTPAAPTPTKTLAP